MTNSYQSIPSPSQAPHVDGEDADSSSLFGPGESSPLQAHDSNRYGSRGRDVAIGAIGASIGVLISLLVAYIYATVQGREVFFLLARSGISPRSVDDRTSVRSSLKGADSAAMPTEMVVSLGPRPYFLVSQMDDSAQPLKRILTDCAARTESFRTSDFVIGHRGAALQFPEHTLRSHSAASRMGAGLVECDVTFTRDLRLVCRHSQCDLHLTTNVLTVPELASRCAVPYEPATDATRARAKCCTTDFTLAEIQSLCGTMDAVDIRAWTAEAYGAAGGGLRTHLYSGGCPRIPSHREYIAAVRRNGGRLIPELKPPQVGMPFRGVYTQEMFAQQMMDDYRDEGIDPADVFPQSFRWEDLYYWRNNTDYGRQAVALDDNYLAYGYSREDLRRHFAPLIENDVKIVAPPIWMLLRVSDNDDGSQTIEPSLYAKVANESGLDIITWTLERSDSLARGGSQLYRSIGDVLERDADVLNVLHILADQVGITGIFTDWASTVTFYANCMGLKLR